MVIVNLTGDELTHLTQLVFADLQLTDRVLDLALLDQRLTLLRKLLDARDGTQVGQAAQAANFQGGNWSKLSAGVVRIASS